MSRSRSRTSLGCGGLVVAIIAIAAVGALLTLFAGGSSQTQPPAAPDPTTQTPSRSTPKPPHRTGRPSGSPGTASTFPELAAIPVKGRAPMTGYSREQFGSEWADVDDNGCDTRNDILRRDLRVTDLDEDGCTVLAGVLEDPYSGRSIDFVRGPETSFAVQIDHVVALGNAWQTGAQGLSARQRERFANDPDNLLAVDGPLNLQKGDGDAATWLPPNKRFRCAYVRRQVTVKSRYGLWMTPAEKQAAQRVLATCG